MQLYVPSDAKGSATFSAQRAFSEIITDATTLCPNFYLAAAIQRSFRSPVYAYASSQTTQQPFCPLRPYNAFDYCPHYSFHASDEFLWFQPRFDNYSWGAEDRAFSALMSRRHVLVPPAPTGTNVSPA